MEGAGKLDRRYRFFRRVEQDDGHGNTVAEFVFQFEMAGNRKYLRGGESVMASRLTAKTPAILTIRNCINARLVQPEWQVEDARTGETFQVKESPQESDSRGYVEMLVMSGVAA
ncbi:head-tail adaptor protein [Mesorhizobium sp. BR1-1-3]|uniref:phage head completion protein n=1 Tax=Mesorhizobium sp. BR1-1-3 TaxID=2876651 RepID=UPI001CD06645|nr:head-tail adaptor protein [Mesorhizobium sp. BR1-1-3]MBZ9888123.1 head-tail adaptor protein [Mesorhizobium sp. BR1-1-3]